MLVCCLNVGLICGLCCFVLVVLYSNELSFVLACCAVFCLLLLYFMLLVLLIWVACTLGDVDLGLGGFNV